MSKLRLVKVLCQPVFVIDDGTTLKDGPQVDPVVVSAEHWPDYPTTGFLTAVERLQEQLAEADRDAPES